MSPSWKWMPPNSRDRPASSAASSMVRQARMTGAAGVLPGSTRDDPAGTVTDRSSRLVPVNDRSTSNVAALNVLCPDRYSGNGGVTTLSGSEGDQPPPGQGTGALPGPPP